MRASSSLALALALLAALGVTDARADWRKDYDRGLKAVEAGAWADAEAAFRAALNEDGQPNARKRFQGVVIKLYVPHYYAGLAAYRQGNCQRALEYWGNAASTAVVAGQAELNGVQSRATADCRTRLAASSAPTPAPVVAAAKPPVSQPPASTASTRPAPTPSTSPGIQVPAKPAAVATAPAKPAPDPADTAKPAVTPAPAALVTAVEAYLGGRYAAVVQFDPAALPDARAKAQGYLLRAASRHALSELGQDARLLELARQDVRAARAANRALTPDEVLYSPRFRAFWRQGG